MTATRSIPPLRLAVLGDFEGLHTRRWVEVFVNRGHDVHAISYYRPRTLPPGVTLHVLHDSPAPSSRGTDGANWKAFAQRRLPPSAVRLLNAWRYMRAGLKRALESIAPDVFHAHYVVEHGFYGSFAGFRPYVVSAWGSDVLVESHKAVGRRLVQRVLGAADLVTANDASIAQRLRQLGMPEERLAVVHLGIDRIFLDAGEHSVNLRPAEGPATVISDRALEPLYNIDVILRAFARTVRGRASQRLIVAGSGSQEGALRGLAQLLGMEHYVEFVGQKEPAELAELLTASQVYLSVPSSDSLSLSTVEAMAAGSFPVVSDLPSQDGWIHHGVNGLRVTAGDVSALATAIESALEDGELRRRAVVPNREKAARDGLRERNMLLMERHYYRLAGHPMAEAGEAI